MDKDNKNKWVDALRSGEFKQGKNMLYNTSNDTYCCLGVYAKVICDISKDSLEFGEGYDFCEKDIGGYTWTLANMNDGAGTYRGYPKSFDEIADYIEKNL